VPRVRAQERLLAAAGAAVGSARPRAEVADELID